MVAKDIGKYNKTGSLLDIGTGPGWLLLALKKESPGLSISGIDISQGMVSCAERNLKNSGYGKDVQLKTGAAHSIPFPDRTFDVVVTTGSIHHWSEPELSMKEIYRVLKEGGRAYVYDIVKKIPSDIVSNLKKDYGKFRTALLWLHSFEEPFYDLNEFVSLVEGSGLTLIGTGFTGALCSLYLKK